jgi:hypothetical protein
MTAAFPRSPAWCARYLLFIAGALPYLESTAALAWKLNARQLSFVVAAVLLGSVPSSLFAGLPETRGKTLEEIDALFARPALHMLSR